MNYSFSTIVKAAFAAIVALLGAASAAANGPDLSHLDLGQWLTAIGTAIVAGGALLHRPQSKDEATPTASAAKQITDVAVNAAAAHEDLVKSAIEGIQKVQAATGDLTKLLPGFSPIARDVEIASSNLGMGPLAKQVIDLVPRF